MCEANVTNVSGAAERLFRTYHAHCTNADGDTLFAFLNALHSLHDRLRPAGVTLFDIPEFSALKALRNLFHHQDELIHLVRIVPIGDMPFTTDLLTMCVVPRELIERAIEGVEKRFREQAREAAGRTFHWYGPAVNINPAIFNCMVKVYERLIAEGGPIGGEAFDEFQKSYLCEEANGFSHLVDGRISVHAGNVDELLGRIAGMTTHR
jgi:hypothetical protein